MKVRRREKTSQFCSLVPSTPRNLFRKTNQFWFDTSFRIRQTPTMVSTSCSWFTVKLRSQNLTIISRQLLTFLLDWYNGKTSNPDSSVPWAEHEHFSGHSRKWDELYAEWEISKPSLECKFCYSCFLPRILDKQHQHENRFSVPPLPCPDGRFRTSSFLGNQSANDFCSIPYGNNPRTGTKAERWTSS